jgi:iron complex transport system substrate-binding protein
MTPRTVSLLPAATEIVGALGLVEQLVAISHECDFPVEVNRLPRATYCEIHNKGLSSAEIDRWVSERLRSGQPLYTLDERLLRELAPDLILTQELCAVCAPGFDSVAALARTLPSNPRLVNLEPKCLSDILANVVEIADAMGHTQAGADFVHVLNTRVAAVRARATGTRRRTAFIVEWADPIFNAGHWTPELVELAGGTPVLSAAGERSVRVPWSDLRAADPEVVVIACCGHTVDRNMKDVPALEVLPGWSGLSAVRNKSVFVADGSAYFSRPGPRIIDTLELLASVIHPAECGDMYSGGGVVRLY